MLCGFPHRAAVIGVIARIVSPHVGHSHVTLRSPRTTGRFRFGGVPPEGAFRVGRSLASAAFIAARLWFADIEPGTYPAGIPDGLEEEVEGGEAGSDVGSVGGVAEGFGCVKKVIISGIGHLYPFGAYFSPQLVYGPDNSVVRGTANDVSSTMICATSWGPSTSPSGKSNSSSSWTGSIMLSP